MRIDNPSNLNFTNFDLEKDRKTTKFTNLHCSIYKDMKLKEQRIQLNEQRI